MRKFRSFCISSRVIPFLPGLRWFGSAAVVVGSFTEAEEEELPVEVLVVSIEEVFSDGFEGNNESDDLENNPKVSKRLRTFHMV